MSAAIGVILFLIPKTPSIVVLCLVLIFLLLIHPVWNLWWVEKCLIIMSKQSYVMLARPGAVGGPQQRLYRNCELGPEFFVRIALVLRWKELVMQDSILVESVENPLHGDQ